jgi:hypothetical protein
VYSVSVEEDAQNYPPPQMKLKTKLFILYEIKLHQKSLVRALNIKLVRIAVLSKHCLYVCVDG